MAEEGCHPLPVIRVSHAADVAARAGVNRYWLSALVSLELARPEAERRTAAELAQLLRPSGELSQPSLSEYLSGLTPPAEKGDGEQTFLVFDQFEELLTLDPTDDEAKREFVRQVGAALRDGERWALFAVREDHVGALDPYLPLLPTRLAVTFRLDLLRREAAQEAICRPAAEWGVTFESGAVTTLVNELARIHVQDPLTGKSEPRDGLYVEPLHLQLVCQRLWRDRAIPDRITLADLDRLGHDAAGDMRGVAAALAHYYDDCVRAVAAEFAGQGVTERAIRNWFSGGLISPTGLRLPVLLGSQETYGLSGPALRALADRYLIRSDQRHGAIYYELAHDRLVEPVQKSNAAWRKRLAPFQQAAEVWKESGRKNDLLVFGEVLVDGERLDRLGELSQDDRTFLDACREARAASRAREERRQAQRRKRAIIIGAVLVVSAFVALIMIIVQGNRHANEKKELQHKAQLEIEQEKANALRDARDRMKNVTVAYENYLHAWHELNAGNPGVGLERAKDALDLFQENAPGDFPPRLVTMLLPQAIANRSMQTFGTSGDKPRCEDQGVRHTTAVTDIVLAGSARKRLVTRDLEGTVLIWDDPCNKKLPSYPCGLIPSVSQLMVTPGGRYLLVGHSRGMVCRWKLEDWDDTFVPLDPVDSPVTSLFVRPTSNAPYAVVGYYNGNVRLFNWDQKSKPTLVSEQWNTTAGPIISALVTPNALVLTITEDGKVRPWDVTAFMKGQEPVSGAEVNLHQKIAASVVSDDGTLFAAANEAGKVFDYRTSPVPTWIGEFDIPRSRSASPTNRRADSKATILSISSPQSEKNRPRTFHVFAALDTSEGVVQPFELQPGKDKAQVRPPVPLHLNPKARITEAAFSPDGKWVGVGMSDGAAYIASIDGPAEGRRILRTAVLDPDKDSSPVTPVSPVTALFLEGSDGRWVFTGQANGTLRRWDRLTQGDFEVIRNDLMAVQKDLLEVRNRVEKATLKPPGQ
jgi:WD40 repeat protein